MVAEKHKDIYMWMNGACIVFVALDCNLLCQRRCRISDERSGTAICCPLHPALLIFVGNPQAFPYPDFAP